MMKFVVALLVLAALGLLQVEALPYSNWNRFDCVQVPCPIPPCPNPVTPIGQCCPVCRRQAAINWRPPPIDCSAVQCVTPNCPNPVTPKGRCCSVCPKLPPIEPPNCAAVLCATPDCPNPVTPIGQCCPVCPRVAVNKASPKDLTTATLFKVFKSMDGGYLRSKLPYPQAAVSNKKQRTLHVANSEVDDCGTACPPDPYPGFCTKQCVLGCQCPQGTFLDEMANQLCPPDCTHDFCSRNPKALCNVPGPREIPGCFGGQCQLTYCPACYYSKVPRDLPGYCRDCDSPVSSFSCLRNWAQCINDADVWQYGVPHPNMMSQKFFKCYRYPCKLKG